MASKDFALSYTVEIPAVFNDPPIGKQGPAGTIFADVLVFEKQGPAGTIFADLSILKKDGAPTELLLTGLCDEQSRLGPGALGQGAPYSTLGEAAGGGSPPPYSDLSCN